MTFSPAPMSNPCAAVGCQSTAFDRVIKSGAMNMSMKIQLLFLLLLPLTTALAQSYTLGGGDELRIEVFGEPELGLDLTVDDSGHIEYPFAGKVPVAGKDTEQVRQLIVARLKDGYFVDPHVTVNIKTYKPFYIEGEVKSPGSYAFEPGLTVRKAISLAGGLTERASSKKMFVIRAGDANSESVRIELDDDLFAGDVLEVKESFW